MSNKAVFIFADYSKLEEEVERSTWMVLEPEAELQIRFSDFEIQDYLPNELPTHLLDKYDPYGLRPPIGKSFFYEIAHVAAYEYIAIEHAVEASLYGDFFVKYSTGGQKASERPRLAFQFYDLGVNGTGYHNNGFKVLGLTAIFQQFECESGGSKWVLWHMFPSGRLGGLCKNITYWPGFELR